MLGQASDPLLAKAEQQIQSSVKPDFQAALAKVVTAGLKILYAPEMRDGLNHRINSSHNPPADAGKGATRMMYTLYLQSKNTLAPEVLVPGALILAFEYLDLLVKTGREKITPQIIAQTTQETSDAMMAAMKMTPEKFHAMKASHQQAAPADPAPSAPAPSGIINAARSGV